ncbi:HslU--HslV peptidase ATPase subunit, partial [Liquorilactobacillus ghanensis]
MNPIDKTPKQIVKELNNYVIGQNDAKKAIAVALRNRYRRLQLDAEMQAEITPKNVLMIGPTGVGKTEIARRLAKIVAAPFIKVEATKFTEVGYVGRDVESMIRDLVEVAYKMEKEAEYQHVHSQAVQEADKQLIKLLVPAEKKQKQAESQQNFMQMLRNLQAGNFDNLMPNQAQEENITDEVRDQRLSVSEQLKKGLLENRSVTIPVEDSSRSFQNQAGMLGQMGIDLGDALSALTPTKKVMRTMAVSQAREVLARQAAEKLIDSAEVADRAIKRAEDTGIVFIDEIDKVTSKSKTNSGEVSREGVQRDILPIVEGSQVQTKYGLLNTDHI